MPSSLMRARILVIPPMKPSAVCVYETAFCTFVLAACTRRFCASSFSETARPAASSDGLTIFEPEERRFSERPSISWEWFRLRAPMMAWMFVLITLMAVGVWLKDQGRGSREPVERGDCDAAFTASGP